MDEYYMQRALALAAKARGCTSPNPLVGAVIVKDGLVIGEGWHHAAGTPHAEIHALRQAGQTAKGATLYVTLEPCCHQGRTGPCTEAVIAAGISEVVVAMRDPNPLVAGKGIDRLQAAGIAVREGVKAREAALLNEVFIKWIATAKPFVVLKTAMSLDGKIATRTGESQWITGPAARRRVHQLRSEYDAIVTGIGTVLADDPQLTVRLADQETQRNPLRIVVDSMARTPLTAKLITDQAAPTLLAVAEDAPPERVRALRTAGADVICLPRQGSGLNLEELCCRLGQRGVTSLMVESGAALNAAFIAQNLVDKVYWFIAPKLIGGQQAPGPLGGAGIEQLADALPLEDLTYEAVAADILICGYNARREGRDVYRTCGRIGQD